MTLRRALIFLTSMAALIAGSSPTAQVATPFTDAVERLSPAILCLDTAPRHDRAEMERCFALTQLNDEDIQPNVDRPPNPAQILMGWVAMDTRPTPDLTVSVVDGALAYGRCMERAAASRLNPSPLSENAFRQVVVRIEGACSALLPDIVPLLRNEQLEPTESARFLLSRMIGQIAIAVTARERGWYPPSLIPCVRYGDGRPPSAACASRPQRPIRPPAPPPR